MKYSIRTKVFLRHATLISCLAAVIPFEAHAGFFKWIRNEAMPTITGKRPLEVKPHIAIKSGATQFRMGSDSLMIKVGGVTVQTSKLRYRLAQAGCIYATGGDVMTCAPDVVERESKKIIEQIAKDIEVNSDLPPPKPKTKPTPSKHPEIRDGPFFEDMDARVIEWEPMDSSVGFDFNPNTPATSTPSGSGFFHTFAVARSVDSNNRAVVVIIGRIDFAYLQGRKGGILCLFGNEKGKYLRDRNGDYADPVGVVAIGSSETLPSGNWLEKMTVRLVMPWRELELPDDVDPYATKLVQCNVTVDNNVTQALDWAPF